MLLNGNNYHQMHAMIYDILYLRKEITFYGKSRQKATVSL